MIWTGLFGKFPHVIDISTTRGMEARGEMVWAGAEIFGSACRKPLSSLLGSPSRRAHHYQGLFQLVDVSSAFGTPFPLIFA